MSKLPEHLEPITDFHMFGINVVDMNRDDLLKVIKWLADQMAYYKKSDEEVRSKLNDMYLGASHDHADQPHER